jgi:hypothetical protein
MHFVICVGVDVLHRLVKRETVVLVGGIMAAWSFLKEQELYLQQDLGFEANKL